MKLILFIYSFLNLLLHKIIYCSNIKVWNYNKITIKTLAGATFTGATYLLENNNYIVSYINTKSYIQNLISNEKIEINDKLCPMSYNLYYRIHILFTENNLIYTNVNSKFKNIKINDIEDIKSLRGSLVNNYNELIVGFVGTNQMRLYGINDNELETKTTFIIDGKILTFSVVFFNTDYIYLLYYVNNIYILGHYSLSNKNLVNNLNYQLDVELYNIAEIYNGFYFSINVLILFSYNKNENNFVFYLYEYSNENYILKKFGNKYNFVPFRNAKIINAFFLPYSEYLIYLIELNKERYAGIVDLINDLIIFNFKTTTEFISYEAYYLLYGENNNLEKLCPFNNKNPSNCYLFSGYTRYLIKITSKNENSLVNKCPMDAIFSIEGLYCFDICPSGYYASGFSCEKCAIYDLDSEKCVESCDENKIYEELNAVCYSCKPFEQYKYTELNICINDCSIYNLVKDEINSVCVSCKDLGQFFLDGKCVIDCGPAHIKDEERGLCVNCKKETPYYQNGECVKECDKLYTLDLKTKKCILCTVAKPYLQDGECVKECDIFHKFDKIKKLCINCQNDTNGTTPYLENNECVEKCSDYYKKDEINKKCINCKEDKNKKIFLQDNECVENCNDNYKKDNTNKFCINCQKEKDGPFLQDNECVSNCDKYYLSDNINKICINCKKNSSGPYLQENQCVSKCKDYYITDDENMICYNCSVELGDDYYYFNGTCVKECPSYYVKNEINKICYKCDENSELSYYENGKCVKDCSKYYYKNKSQKICLNCSEINKYLYFQDGECVEKCKDSYLKNSKLMVCYNCSLEHPKTPYYMDNTCVRECDSYYILDELNKVCYKCKDKYQNKKYYENGDCVEKCSDYLVVDNTNNLCINCSENLFFQDNDCVSECSPGYKSILHPNKACINCYKTYGTYEENGQCTSSCTENRINNPDINQCQFCRDFNKEKIYYDNMTNKCVDECPEMYEKNKEKFICQNCLNYYDKLKRICVDKCPDGSQIREKMCEKCKFYDKINNVCTQVCLRGQYPFLVEEDNYSICYECFCGFGNCLINTNNKEKNSKLIDLYSCDCDNELIYGIFCQYKYNSLKKNDPEILKIKPLQDVVYTNKNNIFSFEYNKNKNINSLRNLLIEHDQFTKRRFEYNIEWKLIQNNCPENKNIDIKSNELFFIIESGTFKDNCENIIQLNINNNKDKSTISKQLIVKTKSIEINSFNIIKGEGILYRLNNNSLKLDESSTIGFNYIYKYYYITDDEEEFSLTDYMKNNNTSKYYMLPYCSSIKARIKTDYGEIIETTSKVSYNYKIPNKNLSDTLQNLNLYKNKTLNKTSLLQLSTNIKSFFYINNNYNYSLNDKIEDANNIIEFINKYLPQSIKNETNTIKNNYPLDENEESVDSNIFISLINQINKDYYENYNDKDKEKNEEFYIKLIDLIINSLNNSNIQLLSQETILSFLRTIDNLLLVINQKNILQNKSYEIYDKINLLKNIIAKNVISGTKVDIEGNFYNIHLIKPGFLTEYLSISIPKTREGTYQKNFMEYKNYIIEHHKLQNNRFISDSECISDSLFCISKNIYDYLYDEITYLKNEKMFDLIISISQFYNNNNSFISKWNKITNNIYLNNKYLYPKLISDFSFVIEIFNPINNNTIKNLTQFKYNLYFDLKKKDKENKNDLICIAFNSIKINNNNNIEISQDENCITYIDSKKHKIVCKCNTDGEVVLLSDKNLSSLYKNIFYKKHKYKIINNLSGCIILSSLALITIFSVFFIFYEFYEDKNNPFKLMNATMRIQYEYDNFKNLNNSSKYLFALYLIYYKYSFFNIFSTYKYNHPRYIRFFMEIIKILLNILISTTPLYHNHFKIKDEFINEFDPKDEEGINYRKENLSLSYQYAFNSFLYSLFASIIIFFITLFIYKFFEFKKMRRLIWKPKKDIFKEFVYGYLKKETMFGKKFKKIKKRMIAYANLCGKYILDDNKRDKFSSYLEYKSSQQNSNIPISENDDIYNSLIIKNNTSTNINNLNSLFPSLKEQLLNKSNTIEEPKTTLYKNYSINKKSNNKKNKKLIMTKGVQPFTLSNKTQINDSIWNIYRLELIRNKYIFNSQNSEYYRDKNSKIIKYIELAIETQKNYSYILSNNISFNQLSTSYNKKRINVIRLINISLFITLIIIDIALIIMLKTIYEKYDNYIIINWLIPVLFQIIIVNCIINYIYALFASILLFSNYKRKKNCFEKFIFNIFVEKYMRYLFKIRTLINKYYREFENMK